MVRAKKVSGDEVDYSSLFKDRVHVGQLTEKDDGKEVTIAGWLYDSRELGKLKFALLRDASGEIQITGFRGETNEETFDKMGKINRESAILVRGKVKKAPKAPGGRELAPTSIEILNSAENPLLVDVSDFSKTELPKRLDYRFLDLHRKRTQAIFKVESTILESYVEFMKNEGAMFAQFPSIIGSSSEGGTEVFEAKYFDKKVFLSQSCQLYKQMLACAVEKVYTIFTVWRAEKHNTVRHLNESRQLDFEMGFADEFKVMDILARSVQFIVSELLRRNKAELDLLEVKIRVPEVKYMTFAEVSDLMKKNKVDMGKDDLSGEAEKKLGELYPDTIVFVHDWPLSGKPFYIMPKGKDLSGGFDAIYKGIEISSGGQRIHIPELLTKRLKAKDMDPKDFESYIQSFRYGAPPHSGFGMGLERLTMIILGLTNIREATLFPRDRDRLTP